MLQPDSLSVTPRRQLSEEQRWAVPLEWCWRWGGGIYPLPLGARHAENEAADSLRSHVLWDAVRELIFL